MVIDEFVGTSNNDSDIVVKESSQTKLFPIFINQTSSPSHVVW